MSARKRKIKAELVEARKQLLRSRLKRPPMPVALAVFTCICGVPLSVRPEKITACVCGRRWSTFLRIGVPK